MFYLQVAGRALGMEVAVNVSDSDVLKPRGIEGATKDVNGQTLRLA